MATDCHHGKRLGKILMNAIIAHPRLKNVKNFELTCTPDMIGFYEKFEYKWGQITDHYKWGQITDH